MAITLPRGTHIGLVRTTAAAHSADGLQDPADATRWFEKAIQDSKHHCLPSWFYTSHQHANPLPPMRTRKLDPTYFEVRARQRTRIGRYYQNQLQKARG